MVHALAAQWESKQLSAARKSPRPRADSHLEDPGQSWIRRWRIF